MDSSNGDHRSEHRSLSMDQKVAQIFIKSPGVFSEILEKSKARGLPPISIGAFEGQMLKILLKSIGARRGIEIGTLGGYSSAWIADALGPEGKLISIEVDAERAVFAQENLKSLGFGSRVEVRKGSGLEVLETLAHERDLDFVFVDADKKNYSEYFEWAIPRLRKGGLLLGDNAYLFGGMSSFGQDPKTLHYPEKGLHSFNEAAFRGMSRAWELLAARADFESLIFPTGDGLAVGLKI